MTDAQKTGISTGEEMGPILSPLGRRSSMARESRDIKMTGSHVGPNSITWCISIAMSLMIVNQAAYADPRPFQAVRDANACPREELKMPSIPGGRPLGPPRVSRITVSSTVAASDESTSTVIRPDPKDQINC